MPEHRRVVVVTGLPPDALGRHTEYAAPDLTLALAGPSRNLLLDHHRIAAQLGGGLPERLLDLLEIALAVYCADIAFLRRQNEDWVRSTSFLAPVRDPDFWQTLEPQLAELLYVLSHDAYTFRFEPRTENGGPRTEDQGQTPTASEGVGRHDCAALLSGGIDSFAGATALLATGRRPLFVAHRPQNPAIVAAQEHVREALGRRFGPGVALAAIRCGPGRTASPEHPYPPPAERETSQRTRSFLFLSLGAAACCAAGVDTLYCPENGVLALNVPLTEARVGGCSTGSTRPKTLVRFSQLLAALGCPIRVENPFVYQTKAQLIRDVLRPHFSVGDIQGAVSCWMAGRYSRPCGGCVPCLIRAIGMEIAGLPREAYLVDPLATGGATGPESAARANLVDLLTFAQRFRSLDDMALLRVYPVLLEFPPEVPIRPAVAMLRRFADEVAHVLQGEE